MGLAARVGRIAILILLLPLPSSLTAGGVVCAVCGSPITGRYLEEEGKAYHETCYEEHRAPRCGVCGKGILGPRLEWEGKFYHPDCYRDAKQPRCDACGQPIEGEYLVEGEKSYHPSCHRTRSRRCAVCSSPVSGSYLADGWGNPFHSRHGTESVCPFCNRVMAASTTGGGFISSANGMRICGLCARRAISHLGEAIRIFERVRGRLEGLFPVPEGSFAFRLVDKAHLIARLPRGELIGNELGVTFSERTRRAGTVSRKIEVSVLSGIPDWLLEGVAAHELVHVWQQLHDLDDLPLERAEGVAEYASFLVLREGNTEEGRVKIEAMKSSRDPVYGVGFRKVLRLAKGSEASARVRRVLEGGEEGWPANP